MEGVEAVMQGLGKFGNLPYAKLELAEGDARVGQRRIVCSHPFPDSADRACSRRYLPGAIRRAEWGKSDLILDCGYCIIVCKSETQGYSLGRWMMAETIRALFDGKVFRPAEPVALEPNTYVQIIVSTVSGNSKEPVSFLRVARALNLEGPPDWSANLDKYLYDLHDERD